MSEHNTYVISGLKEKRSTIAGRMVELRREFDGLQGDLANIDQVLRLYDVEPSELPTKGRMPVRSVYFGRSELTRRCRDMLREKGTIRAEDVAIQAMREKGIDLENRKVRGDFTRRISITLNDLRKAGSVEKIGHGRRAAWRLVEGSTPPCDDADNTQQNQ